MEELRNQLGVILVSLIAIPWCVWVTASIFNQRQEVALLRQIFETLRDAFGPKMRRDP